jgi:L-amino acid N-acyltransferase YncA
MSAAALSIRPAAQSDAEAICAIGRELVEDGTVYAFPPGMTDAELEAYWLSPRVRTYVAEAEGEVLGCYIVRANQPGRGGHVANASYAVSSRARGKGVGRAMGEHSLAEARRLGFQAMQFNLVVSTNEPAVALWKSLGFEVVGTLPKAFDHARLGLVDALVMYRVL